MAIYDKDGVFIDSHELRFGGYRLPIQRSNAGPIYLDGLHDVVVRSEGLFSSKYRVVLVFFDDKPDKVVWVTNGTQAEEIAAAIKDVLL